MPHKTLYVSRKDLGRWSAAERVAILRGVSVSQVVGEALDYYLPRASEDSQSPADKWAHIAADAA